MSRRFAVAVSLVSLAALFLCGPATARWRPAPTTAPWQWQLQGRIDTGIEASVYDVDGFETTAGVVRRLHREGRRAICYLDVGSWESYRPDARAFPRSAIGRRYEGFPNERWLDVRRFHLFAKPLRRRFGICARKGFDAVEPDNVAGWENKTGFPIGAAAQLRFNRWMARQVHRRGMAVALKNDGRQAGKLLGVFDFAIVEQCFQYEECGRTSRSCAPARPSSRPSTSSNHPTTAKPRPRSTSARLASHTTSSPGPGVRVLGLRRRTSRWELRPGMSDAHLVVEGLCAL